jgi:hypothetical protein
LGLLCAKCGGALRGSYIQALGKKYHVEHFTCTLCTTKFGPSESYYEHEGAVYCHYHFSTLFAAMCSGCHGAILKQFVEVTRNAREEQWHPECYMIHKSWNVTLAPAATTENALALASRNIGSDDLRIQQNRMEEKVSRIWNVLSVFEESAAACISDMLLNVSNGLFVEGIHEAASFILHVEVLFAGIDRIEELLCGYGDRIGLVYHKEPKLLCKKIVGFFSLLSHSHENMSGVANRRLAITQELLALVTSLAHLLKILIRVALCGALKLERQRNRSSAVFEFLDTLMELSDQDKKIRMVLETDVKSDLCHSCNATIEESCIALSTSVRWHMPCFCCFSCRRNLCNELGTTFYIDNVLCCHVCIRNPHRPTPGELAPASFSVVSSLSQYTFLLRVALKRLLGLLRVEDDLRTEAYIDQRRKRVLSVNFGEGLPGANNIPMAELGDDPVSNPRLSMLSQLSVAPQIMNSADLSLVSGIPSKTAELASGGVLDSFPSQKLEDSVQPSEPKVSEHPHLQSRELNPVAGVAGIQSSFHNMSLREQQPATGEELAELGGAPPAQDVDARALPPHSTWPRGGDETNQVRPVDNISSQGPPCKAEIDDVPFSQDLWLSDLSGLETFVVRNLAVRNLENVLSGLFKSDDLVELVEDINSKKSGNSIWDRFVSTIKGKNKKSTSSNSQGTFGVPLENLVHRTGVSSNLGAGQCRVRIPIFVQICVDVLLSSDLHVEGLFRKNGNIKRLSSLREALDANPMSAAIAIPEEQPIQIAALLKKFFREMPEPLMTFRLYRLFISCTRIVDEHIRQSALHYAMCLLPKPHRDTLEVVCICIKRVSECELPDDPSRGSKMDYLNLATVMAPNLLVPPRGVEDDHASSVRAIFDIFRWQDSLWTVPDDIAQVFRSENMQWGSGAQDIGESGPDSRAAKEILKKVESIAKRNHSQSVYVHSGLNESGNPWHAASNALIEEEPTGTGASPPQLSAHPQLSRGHMSDPALNSSGDQFPP